MQMMNRILIVFFSFLLLAVGMALIAIPQRALAGAQTAMGYLAQFGPATIMALGGLLVAAAVLLLLVEIRPRRPTQFIAQVGDGVVRYPHQAVATAIDRELTRVEGVRESKTTVSGSGQDVEANIKLVIAGASATPEVISRSVAQARSKVEDSFGLKLRHPRISVDRIDDAPVREREPEHVTVSR